MPKSFIPDQALPPSFVPDSSTGAGAPPASPQSAPSLGRFALNAGAGAVNFINNNPISHALTSLAALPVQLGVKGINAATGSHFADPYAGGIGGAGPLQPVGVTSSDQPAGKFAEEEAGNALTAGSLFVPAGAVADAVTGGAGILGSLGRIGAQTALGGAQGLAGGMQSGQSADQLKGSAGLGALTGGAFGTAGEVGSGLLNKLGSASGVSRLTQLTKEGGAAKTLTKALNDYSTPTTNPIKTLAENGLIKDFGVNGTKVGVENLTNESGTGSLDLLIQEQKDAGSEAVSNMRGGVSLNAFRNAAIDAVKADTRIGAMGDVSKTVAVIERKFNDYAQTYGENLSYKNIDAIRKAMNTKWDPETVDAERAIGNAARDSLYKGAATPGALTNEQIGLGKVLQTAMKNEQELINAKSFANRVAGHAVNGGQLKKWMADAAGAIIGGGVGGAAGSILGPFGIGGGGMAGAAVGGATANALTNRLNEGYFNVPGAQKAASLSRFISSPMVQGTKQIGKSIFITGLGGGR